MLLSPKEANEDEEKMRKEVKRKNSFMVNPNKKKRSLF